MAKDDAEAQFDWAMAQIKIGDNDRAASGFIAALVLSFKKDTGYSSSAERIIGPAIHNLAICLHSRALQRAKANDLLGTAVNIRAAAELDGSDGRDKLWADLRKDLSPEQAALAETTFPFLLLLYCVLVLKAPERDGVFLWRNFLGPAFRTIFRPLSTEKLGGDNPPPLDFEGIPPIPCTAILRWWVGSPAPFCSRIAAWIGGMEGAGGQSVGWATLCLSP